jgi:hypothetical protein
MRHPATALISLTLVAAASAQPALPPVEVFKSATCGCCTKWVGHLRQHGFRVTAADVPDLAAVRAKHGVPDRVASCHTALVGGYVVEGHVPASDVRKLLRERPAARGIATPGMPMGSPGMEGPYVDPYDVVSFDRSGRVSVFTSHR